MRIAIVTAPVEAAPGLARALVEERLVACVNIVPRIRSIYRWQGKIEDGEEALLLLKTTSERLDRLTARIKELHPYEVPEIIALTVNPEEGNPDYIDWVREVVG